jgi:hypothetical protein
MSVKASLATDTGRSSDVRAEAAARAKKGLPRWHMPSLSTPGSSGVMGVMACWKGSVPTYR